MAGVVDGGRALFTYMALRDAAQEGALYGSINPADTAGILARVRGASTQIQDLANGGDLVVPAPTYSDPGNVCMGTGITIEVSTPNFSLTMPFLGVIVGSQTIPIVATITDTILRPPCTGP